MNQIHIWYALLLHDIKSRFFGNGLGYMVTIVWPLAHILLIIIINSGRLTPHGSSMVLYVATAVIPWIACNYIGRFILMGVVQNRNFLQYPIIKPLDLMIARSFLEIVNNAIVVFVIIAGLSLFGVDVVPANIAEAASAWACCIMLGVGLGVFNGVICMAFPLWNLIFTLFIIIAWATCGIGIDPENLPAEYAYYLSYNPVLHAVEWMRQAYYTDFRAHLLNKNYLVYFGLVSLSLGLILERVARAFWLQSR